MSHKTPVHWVLQQRCLKIGHQYDAKLHHYLHLSLLKYLFPCV
jgi:hypothetical protein